MEIAWKTITMEDADIIRSYYKKEQSRSCEFTFANNYLWAPHYHIRYAIVEGMLVFLSDNPPGSVSFPLGDGNIRQAVETLWKYFDEKGMEFRMHLVTPIQFARLDELMPGTFQIDYDRDAADYVYEAEKLLTLSGKKLHSKRNHINKFRSEHEDWQYEKITGENLEDCLQMAHKWCEKNGCFEAEPGKKKEFCVTLNALKNLEALNLQGGLLRLDGEVVAFSIGEPCSDDTFVVHIEKAFAEIQGAYPMINQQFVENEAAGYTYINREEDMGDEGLRKAKQSYYPAFLQEKGIVTLKQK